MAAATFLVTIGCDSGFTDRVDLSASGQPASATVSFSPSFLIGPGTSTMTVTIAAAAPASSSWLTVTGTSQPRVRTAAPVALNVERHREPTRAPSASTFAGSSPVPMDAAETAGVVPISQLEQRHGLHVRVAAIVGRFSGAQTGVTVTWAANSIWMTPIVDQAGKRTADEGISRHEQHLHDQRDGRAARPPRVRRLRLCGRRQHGPTIAPVSTPSAATASPRTTIRSIDAARTNFSGVFQEASNSKGNYVKFSITGSDFTLTATPAPGSGTQRAPVNAIEIVPSASVVSRAISVSFVGTSAIAMAATEMAGVVAKANWNNAAGAARAAPLPLIDEAGTGTTATIVWNANNIWATPITDQPGNRRMMKGYLDTSTTSVTTITVPGLDNRDYDVYVYADGDNRTFSRSAAYTVSGPGIATTTVTLIDQANTNFAGTLIPADNSAGNYIRFSVTGTAFTLTAAPLTGGNATLRAPVNAMQIVPKGS